MKESTFPERFKKVAQSILESKYVVKKGANLLYELFLDNKLNVCPNDIKNPKRGNSAFQTDLCFFEKKSDKNLIPRIVIEFKTKPSTHDVLTYSSKAGKHKSIYPYLRYGLIASEIDKIPGRFFIHNEHIDFIVAAQNYKNKKKLKSFAKDLIRKESKISKTLEDIHCEAKKCDFYRTDVIFRNTK